MKAYDLPIQINIQIHISADMSEESIDHVFRCISKHIEQNQHIRIEAVPHVTRQTTDVPDISADSWGE